MNIVDITDIVIDSMDIIIDIMDVVNIMGITDKML